MCFLTLFSSIQNNFNYKSCVHNTISGTITRAPAIDHGDWLATKLWQGSLSSVPVTPPDFLFSCTF